MRSEYHEGAEQRSGCADKQVEQLSVVRALYVRERSLYSMRSMYPIIVRVLLHECQDNPKIREVGLNNPVF